MKKTIFFVIAGLLLASVGLYAANGDLIVNGKVGIGTTSPVTTLEVNKAGAIGGGVWIDGTNDTRVMIGRGQPTVWSWANGWQNPGDFSLIEESVRGAGYM